MSLELREGNLLEASVEALVNTVNTVGVMGKGIALQFRKAFPDNYEAYRKACEKGEVVPGKMFVSETGQLAGPRLIVNFPTKRHWRSKTRIEDIESGLDDLVKVINVHRVKSIAVPPLGCGNGGLQWAVVQPMIEDALRPLGGVHVQLFKPTGAPPPRRQPVATKPPRMTRGRAALLSALEVYRTDPGTNLTRLVAQKMAYFLQVAGEPLRLSFKKGPYGPYAEPINHVLQRMEGHFMTGYGDRSSPSDLQLIQAAVERAHSYLEDDRATRQHVERVSRLIEGFESPLGLELLATVHWVAKHGESTTPDEAVRAVAEWTPRKQEVLRPQHVMAAWKRLEAEGWIAQPTDPQVRS